MSYSSYVESIRRKIKIVATVLFLVVIFCIIGEVGGKAALAMTDDGTVEEKTTEEKEYYEYTDEELEQVYLEAEREREEEIKLLDELAEYIAEDNNGLLKLNIPEGITLNATYEQITRFEQNLNSINNAIHEGEIVVDDNGDYYINEIEEDFVLQNGRNQFYVKTYTKSWTVGWGRWKKTFTVKIPTGYVLKLQTGYSIVLGISMFVLMIVAAKYLANPKQILNDLKSSYSDLYYLFKKLGNHNAILTAVYAFACLGQALFVVGMSSGPQAIIMAFLKIVGGIVAYILFAQVGKYALSMGLSSAFSGSKKGIDFNLNLLLSGEKKYQY